MCKYYNGPEQNHKLFFPILIHLHNDLVKMQAEENEWTNIFQVLLLLEIGNSHTH